jgi:hypothetical protein
LPKAKTATAKISETPSQAKKPRLKPAHFNKKQAEHQAKQTSQD